MKNHKARITVTLRSDLLPRLDDFIDGEKIRNRSHAIEYILGQHLGMGIQYAVIFASLNPKQSANALTRVRNRPIIAYIFEALKENGIRNVVVIVDKYGKQLKEYIGDGDQWGLTLQYVEDRHPRGTAHALSLVQAMMQRTFLVLFSDVLGDLNFLDFVEHHQQSSSIATLALTHQRSQADYGVARMEGNKIKDFREKPGAGSSYGLVNAGIYLLEPEIFKYIEPQMTSLEKEVFPILAANEKLCGYPFQGKWFDIGDPAHRRDAERSWRYSGT